MCLLCLRKVWLKIETDSSHGNSRKVWTSVNARPSLKPPPPRSSKDLVSISNLLPALTLCLIVFHYCRIFNRVPTQNSLSKYFGRHPL